MPEHRFTVRRALTGLLALVLGVGGAACTSGTDQAGEIAVPSTTKVLDEDALDGLDVAGDGTLTFTSDSPSVAELEPGDVAVADVSDSTPEGLLRRVTAVEEQGSTTVVATEPAGIEEAIERGRVAAEVELTIDDVGDEARGELEPAAGRAISVAPSPVQGDEGGLVVAIDGAVLASGPEGQVTVSGSLSIRPSFELVIDIDDFTIEKVSLSLGVDEAFSLAIDASGATSFERELRLATIPFTPITIPAGPLPVVLVPLLELYLQADGQVTAAASAAVSQQADGTVGVGWRDGRFAGFGDADLMATFDPPTFEGAASGRVAAGGRLGIYLYGLVGGAVGVDGYVGLDGEAHSSPPCVAWSLTGGVEAHARLDLLVETFDETVFDNEEVLDSAACDGTTQGGGGTSVPSWSRSFRGDRGAAGGAIAPTSDGGWVVAGTAAFTESSGGGDSLWVAGVDGGGDLLWQRQVGVNAPTAIAEVEDGYLVGTRNGEIVALDRQGELRWVRRYQPEAARHTVGILGLASRPGGGAVATGPANVPDGTRVWAMAIDDDGAVEWSRTYGSRDVAVATGLAAVPGGGWAISAQVSRDGILRRSGLVRLDGSGDVLWDRAYGVDWRHDVEPAVGHLRAVAAGADGFVLVGNVPSPRWGWDCETINEDCPAGEKPDDWQSGSNIWAVGVDGGGSLRWSTNVDLRSDADDAFSAAVSGGTAVVAGTLGQLGDGQDLWVGGFDPTGNLAWSNAYGGSGYDSAGPGLILRAGSQLVASAPDGGAAIVGTTESLDRPGGLWVLKLTRTGRVPLSAGLSSRPTAGTFDDVLELTVEEGLLTGGTAALPLRVEDITDRTDTVVTEIPQIVLG